MNHCLQKQPSSPHLPLPDYVDSAAVLDEIRAGTRLVQPPVHPCHPYHPCHPCTLPTAITPATPYTITRATPTLSPLPPPSPVSPLAPVPPLSPHRHPSRHLPLPYAISLPYRRAPHGCRRQPPKVGARGCRYGRVGGRAIDDRLPSSEGGAPAQALRAATPPRGPARRHGGQGVGQRARPLEPRRALGSHARRQSGRPPCRMPAARRCRDQAGAAWLGC